jgi:uncharacterized protein (DUF1697 family)
VSLYAAFLRGMNVGGHRLTNEELRAHFTAMGFTDVATFRASGNVVFADDRLQSDARAEREVAGEIEQGLSSALGYEVPTFIRTAQELHEMAAEQPFAAAHVERSAGKLQVALLHAPPSPSARKAVLALSSDSDRLSFGARELYWLPSAGLLESPLDLKLIGKLLGTMTTRTQGTIEQITAKHFA